MHATHSFHRMPAGALLFLLLLVPAAARAAGSDAATLPPAVEAAEAAAVRWLQRQVVPNDIVPSPDPGRRRLVLSYLVPSDDPAWRFVYGRSAIYDDALAAVALTMMGQYPRAEFILGALARLVSPEGTLWFAYNTQNSWPDSSDHDGAVDRSGALAWAGYAFTYYLGARTRTDPSFATRDPLGVEFLRAARSIGSALVARQVRDRADRRYGLITGGSGATTVAIESAATVERFDGGTVRWVSVEHNIDAWFFLRDLARLAPDPGAAAAADLVRSRLGTLWNPAAGQFFQGIHEDRTTDTALPLDCATWGALYLVAQGSTEQARRCVAALQPRFAATLEGMHGFRPYGPDPVYPEKELNAFFYPGDPGKRWQDLPFIWGEGSFGAAAALIRAGDRERALQVLDSLRPMAVDGGFRYATTTVPHQFSNYPSVAATAWFIIAAEMLRGGPAAETFWGK
jgi:hypothetical protein